MERTSFNSSIVQIEDIANLISATMISRGENDTIHHLALDSRSTKSSPNQLYFAIKGHNHNGHDFIPELIAKGITNFVVELDVVPVTGCNILKVQSSVGALQALSQAKRSPFEGPVVGITGSNGKTIVKEWLSTILSVEYYVIKSPKSYNSQIGVPLSVWPLSAEHDIAVFEAGISKPGEMEHLASIIRPTLGIFTNIGSAHEENFLSQTEKIQEKLMLFKACDALIFSADQLELSSVINTSFSGKKIDWSFKTNSSSKFKVKLKNNKHLSIESKLIKCSFSINLRDQASVENIIHSIIAALELGVTPVQIQEGISMISPIKMRLELKKGIHHTYLIDDTYNNDLVGLQKALDFMDQQQLVKKKSVILSDFLQNKATPQFFKDLNQLLVQKSIGQLIAIGSQLSQHKNLLTIPCSFYPDTESFLASSAIKSFKNELILIKGARQFRLERVSKALSEKAHKTILEINLDAITHNLNYYRSLLKPETKVMVVVKALAYGAGSTELSKLLEFHKVDYLAVAYADEGVILREEGIKLPIMVMNASEDDPFNLMQYDLEPEIYSLAQLKAFLEAYRVANKVLPAHLILNTGMNRLGFNDEEIDSLTELIQNNPEIEVKSIFSHLAASEDIVHDEFTKQQIDTFTNSAQKIEETLNYKPLRHILNSGGIIRFAQYQQNMVRLGIGLHGVDVSKIHADKLENPSTLKTVISQIRTVPTGETIGYGRSGKAEKNLTIATIAIGYADGYLRYFSNGNAYVLVNGQKAKTIGHICMDMTMIDVTGLDVNVGDEVIIFGKNPTVSQLAVWGNTIPYEILTNVSDRVKRIFYSE